MTSESQKGKAVIFYNFHHFPPCVLHLKLKMGNTSPLKLTKQKPVSKQPYKLKVLSLPTDPLL